MAMNAIALKKTLVRFQVEETAIILAASVILPFMVHLVPPLGGMPLGARLLPIFYAPFIAVVLFRPHVAVITGLLSPALNSWFTGHPTPERVAILTLELVIFSAVSYLIRRRWRDFPGAAPLGYLAAVFSVTYVLGPKAFLTGTLVNVLPGITMLFLVNIFLLRFEHR